MTDGWVRLYKSTAAASWFKNSKALHVYITLLLNYDYKSGRSDMTVVGLSEATGIPRTTVWRCLRCLEKDGRIRRIHGGGISITHVSPSEHEQHEDYTDSILDASELKELVGMRYHLDADRVSKMAEDFILDCHINGKKHTSVADARRHFSYWVNKKLEILKNGKNSKRRSAPVTARSPEDYEGTF